MKRISLLGCLILLATFSSYACQCRNMTFHEEVFSVKNIFVGTVLDRQPIPGKDVSYLFSISQNFKGDLPDTININTGFGGPDCGMNFEIGKTYIVFSNLNRTSRCSRNSLVHLSPDLEKLKYLFQPGFPNGLFKTTTPFLSDTEAEYLNFELLRKRNDFDFSKKKVVFSLNGNLIDKQRYFKDLGGKFITTDLIVLTDAEKLKNYNYDAIIVSGRKGQISNHYRKRLIKKLAQVE